MKELIPRQVKDRRARKLLLEFVQASWPGMRTRGSGANTGRDGYWFTIRCNGSE